VLVSRLPWGKRAKIVGKTQETAQIPLGVGLCKRPYPVTCIPRCVDINTENRSQSGISRVIAGKSGLFLVAISRSQGSGVEFLDLDAKQPRPKERLSIFCWSCLNISPVPSAPFRPEQHVACGIVTQ